MRFLINFSDGASEEREMSDCSTVELALNTCAGSAPGVVVSVTAVKDPAPEPAPVEKPVA